ncbi:MAG: SlyX family protein [Gammaproteobacteria bacterium]|nr:SlyX family protein [Gammaproteobacteria bacterium]
MEEQKKQEIIIDLQARLAFQEDSLDAVNLTVVRQQSEIEVMKREIVRLRELVENICESRGAEGGAAELPPHY